DHDRRHDEGEDLRAAVGADGEAKAWGACHRGSVVPSGPVNNPRGCKPWRGLSETGHTHATPGPGLPGPGVKVTEQSALDPAEQLARLDRARVGCRRSPRLGAWRQQAAR